ncbi:MULTISPECIES: hydroxyacylglutathione hydrolase [Proteus]|uniref:hydroxyacylglutathione hydrolase n=1 Tax=Proteus TaxID=583 RepID=UPI001377000A|nr:MULTISPECIES: hydroxyacylglutathione hydrolase [Proteus]MCO8049905.1 hydroxyacylglutathione hydrolase [Proteus penneri]MCX2587610.1 hydroxyacylglutathione hydrolase [Proteus penneri]NBL78668.1 hydroxyacylglutathione hydrolase [Proteus sp. G2672]NBM48963.1 hydroxyacylglutathione hydrolase [Proteus sp. G2666]NBM58068.1 hydroxyacylglutathione hydrolase [Proteus sp. G2667]
MELIRIPALSDNYIWLLSNENSECVIVDPSQAKPVIEMLSQRSLTPIAILLTHHHDDHVGGVAELVKKYPNIDVFGPQETQSKGAENIIHNQERIIVGTFTFNVIGTPGHTLGHVAYYCEPYLFCGDTLFSGGCGRLFEGTAQQMFSSLQRLSALPDDTLICCAHEYTLSNMTFAHHIMPENALITDYLAQVSEMRKNLQPTVPITLKNEKNINLFLKSDDIDLQRILGITTNTYAPIKTFTKLRELKDNF